MCLLAFLKEKSHVNQRCNEKTSIHAGADETIVYYSWNITDELLTKFNFVD